MKEYKHQCVEKVYPNDKYGSFHGYRCTRDGTVERDGKWYCKTHDPKAVEAKANAKNAIWDEKRKQNNLEITRRFAEHKACEGISTKALEEGVIQEMIELLVMLRNNDAEIAPTAIKRYATIVLAKLADKES